MHEMGGYLPLELAGGNEYFMKYEKMGLSRYNSGRTAIYAAVKSLMIKSLWLPYFYCPSVWKMLETAGVTLKPYFLTEGLLPKDVILESEDGLILVNYYGILGETLKKYAVDKHNIIFDHSHAFFEVPSGQKNTFSVYSCRKFVGVSDGAYLVGADQNDFNFERDISYPYIFHLMKAYECGTNGAYYENMKNELRLTGNFAKMSILTQRILEGVDYSLICNRRTSNYEYVHRRLAKYQKKKVDTSDHAVPYCYPLFLNRDLRKDMIAEKIYVPTLWKELISDRFIHTMEYGLSKNTLCIPIDQRYTEEDMEYLCDKVEYLMKREMDI